MIVGKCLVDLRLHGTRSLKDKRRIVKGLVQKLQQRFRVACAEVDKQDMWGRAVIGMACVSNEAHHAEKLLREACSWVETNVEGEVLSFDIQIIP